MEFEGQNSADNSINVNEQHFINPDCSIDIMLIFSTSITNTIRGAKDNMKNKHLYNNLYIIAGLFITALMSSCGKSNPKPQTTTVVTAKPVTFGLIEYGTGTDNRIFIPISQIGTKTVDYPLVFDTGSTGLTLDATDIIPASMISSAGIQITGDSVVVNGITITNQTATMSYGDANAPTVEYGNLAYADFTVGDNKGSINIKRVPFFLYYKILDANKNQYPPHSADIFGVGTGFSFTNKNIVSPMSIYNPGTGLTKGFKLAMLNNADFNSSGTYVAGLFTAGLTSADRFSSGFIMHPLGYSTDGGYSPNIPATITYGSNSTAAEILFDTGTPSITLIEDPKANSVNKTLNSLGALPSGTVVGITTNRGFKFNYTVTANNNLTTVQNPNNSNDYRSIVSIDFFTQNEFLTDYDHNEIGLKNN